MQAAIDGAKEVGFTILSMTFSLAAVFIPFLFMGGIIGKLFHEFAVTIGVAILVSGVVSLTLTPMLSSRFLRSRPRARSTAGSTRRRSASSTRGSACTSGRSPSVMRHRPSALVFSAVILVATGLALLVDAEGALPHRRHRAAARDDRGGRGRVVRRARAAPGGRRAGDREGSRRARGDVVGGHHRRGEPGADDDRPQADRRAQAQRRPDRARSRDRDGRASGTSPTYIQNPPAISIGGLATKSLYQYTLQSGDIVALNSAAPQLAGAPAGAPDPDGRDERPADRESAGHRRHRPRGRRRSSASPRAKSRTRCTTRSASGRSRRSTRRPTSTGW